MTLFKGISANYNKKFAICFGNNSYNGTTPIFDNYPFNIPDEANFIAFYVVGGAGGGFSGTAAAGGGGGGSGATSSGIYSAKILPSTIYLSPGSYGLGAVAGSGQTGGFLSAVSLHPITTSSDNNNVAILIALGGSASSSTTGGGGGPTPNVNSYHSGGFSFGGLSLLTGAAGSNSATNVTFPSTGSTILFTGGAGGAGSSNTSGGNIVTASGFNTLWLPGSATMVNGGAGSTVTNAGNGSSGITNLIGLNAYKPNTQPMFSFGGGGGGGATSGNGGNGGNGAPGCGGGGGGISTLGTVGNGGNGGPGFIIIQWW